MVSLQTYTPVMLPHLVKAFWYMEVGHDSAFYEEEIVPDGHNEIIIYLNDTSARKGHPEDEWAIQPDAFIAGQTLKGHKVKMFAGARLYGIRFYPHTSYPFLKTPLYHMADGVFSLSEVLNTEGLWSCITDIPKQTFENLERWLCEKISFKTLNDQGYKYVGHLTAHILKNNGMLHMDSIKHVWDISDKYYGDLFKKYVGITPKHLCNIVRINHFISNKIHHPDLNLTECTYESGYYDQSHLIKSFHQFTGTSPRKYFEDEHQVSNMFSEL